MSEDRKRYGRIEPTCNIETVLDGRGGIFTWFPDEPIQEFSRICYNPGTVRGEHYHPEFTEYLLITSGYGAIVFKEPNKDRDVIHVSEGECIYASPGVAHTVIPFVPLTAVAMLTKKWDDCENPIIKEELTGNIKEK